MLLVGQGMGIRPIKTSASKPPVILPCWLMGGVYIAWSTLWVQITENWESRRQPVNPNLPGKWPLKWCVHACVFKLRSWTSEGQQVDTSVHEQASAYNNKFTIYGDNNSTSTSCPWYEMKVTHFNSQCVFLLSLDLWNYDWVRKCL